jgi:hypothetical protein
MSLIGVPVFVVQNPRVLSPGDGETARRGWGFMHRGAHNSAMFCSQETVLRQQRHDFTTEGPGVRGGMTRRAVLASRAEVIAAGFYLFVYACR